MHAKMTNFSSIGWTRNPDRGAGPSPDIAVGQSVDSRQSCQMVGRVIPNAPRCVAARVTARSASSQPQLRDRDAAGVGPRPYGRGYGIRAPRIGGFR